MEIYAEIKNFSFYGNSGAFYVKGRVIEKKICESTHSSVQKFRELKVDEIVSLKIDKTKIDENDQITLEGLNSTLLNRFLIFHVDGFEPASTQGFKQISEKFLFSTVRKCDILMEK